MMTIFGKVRVADNLICCYSWGRIKEGYLGDGLWDCLPNGDLTHGW
jgi:hypothetical protein